MSKKKKVYVLSIIVFGLVLIVGTYAWFTWKSSDSRLVLTVGEIDDAQVILKPYQINKEIIPVLTYEGEEYTSVEVINKNVNSKVITLYYHINNIDSELISSDFKYTITRSTDNGNTYTEYLSGSFNGASGDSDLSIMNEVMDMNTNYRYRVYLWLDGSSSGQGNIQGKIFDGELRAEIDNGILSTEYQQILYLQSTGTQYIMTDIIPNNETGVYAKLSSQDINNDSLYFGTRPSSNSRFWIGNTNNKAYFGWNANTYTDSIDNTTINKLSLNFLNDRMKVFNSETILSDLETLNSQSYPLTIFAGNDAGNVNYKSSIKLYEFKVSQGSEIIADFIPCYRKSDKEAGLYDIVNGVFYKNAGSGTFTIGVEILPNEYQFAEYLESTGTQYIMTNIIPNNETGVYARLVSKNITKDSLYFGTRPSSNSRFWVGNNINKAYFGWNNYTYTDPIDTTTINKFNLNFLNDRKGTFNSETILSNLETLNTQSYPLTIFAVNDVGNVNYKSSIKLYEFKISQGSKIIADFVPCYHKSDKSNGLYDTVNDVFYKNAGSGTFVIGPKT